MRREEKRREEKRREEKEIWKMLFSFKVKFFVIVAFLLLLFFMIFLLLYNNNLNSEKQRVLEKIDLWKNEISRELFYEGRSEHLEKVTSEVERQSYLLISSSENLKKSLCPEKIKHFFFHKGHPVGFAEFCFSREKNILLTLKGPQNIYLWILILIFFTLLLIWNFENSIKEEKLSLEVEFQKKISDFSRAIAHDMKVPLATFEALYESKNSKSDVFSNRNLFEMALKNLQEMSKDLLSYSFQEKETGFEKQKDLSEVKSSGESVLDVPLEMIFFDFKKKYPEIQWKKDEENFELRLGGPWVRIVNNVIQNAVEAFLEKEKQVKQGLQDKQDLQYKQEKREIEIRYHSTASDHWIVVRDNGPGISEEILNELGEKVVVSHKKDGHGYGIFYCQKEARSCGGEIVFKSHLGMGTLVDIRIPKGRN